MIREVQLSDAQAILDIYAPYVQNTAISFEYTTPTLNEFIQRIRSVQKDHPYLVVEENGKIVGYAYAHAFYGREAYRKSAEVSIYLAQNQKHKGYGKALYEQLEERLKLQGIENLYACIAYSEREDDPYLNRDSILFHERNGYLKCGHFHRCGYKFQLYYDVVYMEKHI